MSDYKTPTLFLGHGSPLNALENNDFTKKLIQLGVQLGKPKAIVMISAHWETEGSFVTAMEHPELIYDFYGFPKELYQVQYRAKKLGIRSWKLDSTKVSISLSRYPCCSDKY